MRTERFYSMVMDETGVADRDRATRAVAAVLHALRDRLTVEEAAQAAAQLPRDLQALWRAGEQAGRQPIKMHRPGFYDRVRTEAGLPSAREARLATAAVFTALKNTLSPGEAEDITAQLPGDLKEVWRAA
jgi:uncharacterized protein (DUF2267 family)